MSAIRLIEGDITDQDVDALVNAANTDLVLGSGVAGAIREKGGPEVEAECAAHGAIGIGESAVTGAGDLAARFVIHAAAMQPGGKADEVSVRNAVRSSLRAASGLGCRTIALPALGAGVGGFSLQRCAEISLDEAETHLQGESSLDEIRIVLLGEPAFRVFEMVQDAARVVAQMERMQRRSD
ncbi:MAG: macro domain-containing protein [Myxococcota bacterium]|nr:macro domain-containing protein [Myxococcota bacterium]